MGAAGFRLGLGALAALLTCAEVALGNPVVLVRPESRDAPLVDAWSRLAAELAIHHFETRVVTQDLGQDPARTLSEIARREDALACFALVQHGAETVVDVWLVDRMTGKTTLRALRVSRTEDMPSLLAIQGVDLLRASLAEFEPDERPAPEVVDAAPVTSPPPTTEERERRRSFVFGMSGLVLGEGTRAGLAYAPALGAWFRPVPAWDLGVSATGPVVGGVLDTEHGSAAIESQLTWLDVRFSPLRSARFTAGINVALGAHYLRAVGNATPPLESRTAVAWSLMGAAGIHGRVLIVPRVYGALHVRAVGLAPRVQIAVARESATLPFPMPSASLGLEVEL